MDKINKIEKKDKIDKIDKIDEIDYIYLFSLLSQTSFNSFTFSSTCRKINRKFEPRGVYGGATVVSPLPLTFISKNYVLGGGIHCSVEPLFIFREHSHKCQKKVNPSLE